MSTADSLVITNPADDPLRRIAALYSRTLNKVAQALREAWEPRQRWGIAGLREESLVFLLAESLYSTEWSVQYEPPYERLDNRTKRADLFAISEGNQLWIEARWWWYEAFLADVLHSLEYKLGLFRKNAHRIALVLTIDKKGCRDSNSNLEWTCTGAAACMEAVLRNEKLEDRWRLRGVSCCDSPYVGIATNETAGLKEGLFVASFIELLPMQHESL